jgi:hypothetical protein
MFRIGEMRLQLNDEETAVPERSLQHIFALRRLAFFHPRERRGSDHAQGDKCQNASAHRMTTAIANMMPSAVPASSRRVGSRAKLLLNETRGEWG